MRWSVILAGLLLLALPAMAEEPPKAAPRYSITPDGDGFIRFDAETGATSHCGKVEGVWKCEPLDTGQGALEARIDALADRVAALAGEVATLGKAVAALEARQAEPAPPPAATEGDREADKAMRFTERLMRRFFDMVKALKPDETRGI
jgi:hypothetical protein